MILRLYKLISSTLQFVIEEFVDATTSKSQAENTLPVQSMPDSEPFTELKLD